MIANTNTAYVNGIPVSVGSGNNDTATQRVSISAAGSSTQTSVAGSATTVNLLSANSLRKGATVFNDSSSILYLKLGSAASITSYTVQMAASSYYEIPFGYSSGIDGIWASATGNARITEIS